MDSLAAGAAAGLVVDLALYPIDTIKTRVQSKRGFRAAGGFARVYKGLSAVVVGSVPSGAAFFFTYDVVKQRLLHATEAREGAGGTVAAVDTAVRSAPGSRVLMCQAVAAMCGETAACCIRVPVEMVKQRMQAGYYHTITDTLRSIVMPVDGAAAASSPVAVTHSCGAVEAERKLPALPRSSSSGSGSGSSSRGRVVLVGVRRLFAGMPIMLLREWPFSVTQMSLYELLKRRVQGSAQSKPHAYTLLPLCGAVSGGCAAFVTTPLDVVKTRIMLMQFHNGRHHDAQHRVPPQRPGPQQLVQPAPSPSAAMRDCHASPMRGITLLRYVVRDVAAEPPRPGDVFGVTQKFFRGATARVLWISLGGSIFFSTYEVVRSAAQTLFAPPTRHAVSHS